MTALLDKSPGAPAWNRHAGWSIVADLTPPELLEARRLKQLRKWIAASLVLVVLLCVAGYVFAVLAEHRASSALADSQARTSELAIQQERYQYLTAADALTQRVNSEIAALTSTKIDVAQLTVALRKALPADMSLTSVNISVTGDAGGTSSTPSLDDSGLAPIGTVTLSGSSQHLVSLAGYVTALSGLKGVTNVWPASNVLGQNGTTVWNLTFQFTTALYVTNPGTPAGGN